MPLTRFRRPRLIVRPPSAPRVLLLAGVLIASVVLIGAAPGAQAESSAVRINTGGPGGTAGGVTWSACTAVSSCGGWVTGGSRYAASPVPTVTGAVAPAVQAIYQTEWSGLTSAGVPAGGLAFRFAVPVSAGQYKVRLHFAENVQTGPGKRVFDVNIEGGPAELTGFDIYAAAGGMNKAIVREFPVTVSDGAVTIDFLRRVENAKISAIEILPAPAGGDAVAPAAPTGLTAATGSSAVNLNWADNAEADLAGYRVQRSGSAGGTFSTISSGLVAGSAYSDQAAPAGVTSYYRVVAVDGSGNTSAPSTTASATGPASSSAFTKITWTSSTPPPQPRHEGFGGYASDGKLYVFGGYRGGPDYTPMRRVDRFDPVTRTWTRMRDLPVGLTHAGTAIDGRYIYFAGGYPEQPDGTGQNFATAAVWRYDTATNTYAALPSMPIARGGGALVLAGRVLHVFGGADSARRDTGTHYAFHLDGGTAWSAAAPLPVPRNHLAGVNLGGKIYAVGGQSGQDAAATYRSDVHAYNPATNTWSAVASLPRGLSHHNASTFVMGGRILVLGGEIAFTSRSSQVLAYDAGGNRWTQLTPLPVARDADVSDTWNGKIYFVAGGSTDTTWIGTPQP
ncbi:MAG: N-acetylneuraminic acid mutarotase [Frankiales bacterium]|nr:N-acetylneuraminic acid mutarotase [Frankiales bacterium]